MNPFNLILPWWAKYLAIAALCASLFGYGYLRGYEHEETAYTAFMAQVDATAKVASAHVKQVTKQQQEITANVQSDWKQNAQALHDYYRTHPNTVRMCNTAYRGTVSIVPKAAEGIAANATGESGTVEASAATEINLEIVGSGLLKLMKKDEWIDKQSAIK